MKELLETIISTLQSFVENSNVFLGIGGGMAVIILESIFPILPLALFIALNVIVFGNFVGFFISWIATILGCSLAFFLFRKGFRLWFDRKLERYDSLKKIIARIDRLPFSSLVIIMAFPFTPAFSINMGAGLSKISYKKFFCALLIAKAVSVYFWGFVGTSLRESIQNPEILLKIGSLLIGSFLLSKLAMKNLNFD